MRSMLKRSALAVVLVCGVSAPGIAEEAEFKAVTPTDTTVSDTELFTRLRFLEEKMDETRTHGQIWYWGWLSAKSFSLTTNTAGIFLTSDHDDKVNHGANAVLGAIGVTEHLLRPLEARHGADPFRGMSEANRQDVIAKLRVAEDQLRRNALRADTRWDWREHAGGAGLALAAGLVSGLWGEAENGIVTGVSSLLGGIASLMTQPWQPKDDWATYQRMVHGGHADLRKTDVYVSAVPSSEGTGMKAGVKFSW